MCDKSVEKEQLVSIIIPVYNERRYLIDCVESAIRQTWAKCEVILVDDGSTNGAEHDCDLLAKKYDNIYVIHKKNEGLSSARITGLKNSNGNWIMFLDNDDVISPNMVESFMNYIFDPQIEIIAGGRIDLENPDEVKWTKSEKAEYIIYDGNTICEQLSVDKQESIITPLWGKVYKRSFLESLDLEKYKEICPTIFFEDVLMTPIIYFYAKKICIVKEHYYIHREVKTSISRSGKINSFYYEQIYSGDILLQFCKQNKLNQLYLYELTIYMRSIIRIWCLMGKDLPLDVKKEYEKAIRLNQKKYIRDYLKRSHSPLIEKIASVFSLIFPVLARVVCLNIYFKKKESYIPK